MKPKDDFTNELDDAVREQSFIQEEHNHQQLVEWEYLDTLELEDNTLNELKDEE